jgi:outer membrane protein assembly factor BamB
MNLLRATLVFAIFLALVSAGSSAFAADAADVQPTPATVTAEPHGSAGDGDWYQFLGPRRNAINECGPLATQWPKEGPKQVWKIPCAMGYAGPMIRDGILVLMDRQPAPKKKQGEEPPATLPDEVTHGLDAATGKELWKNSYPCDRPANARYNTYGPAATPASVDGKVVCMGIAGVLRCLELKTGKLIWEKNLATEFSISAAKTEHGEYNVCASPLLAGGLVIQEICSGGVGLVAYQLADGKEAWRTPLFGNYGSSPTFMWQNQTPVVITVACARVDALKGDLYGFNAASGEQLWHAIAGKSYYNTPFPIYNEGLLVVEGGGGDGPTMAFTIPENIKAPAPVAWKDADHNVRFSNYLIYRGLVFGQGYFGHPKKDDHKMYCLDAKTGAMIWERPHKEAHQWMLGCDGKVIQLHENGELSLFDAVDARKEYHEYARAQVIDHTWSFPALTGGKLYLRSDTQCICLDLAGK